MDKFDNLDAPQFSTFDDTDIEEVETYFEIDHENVCKKTTADDYSMEDYFYSPSPREKPQSSDVYSDGNILELRNRNIRRSLSSGNISTQIGYLESNLQKTQLNDNVSKIPNSNGEFQYGALKKTKSSSQSRIKWTSQDNLNRLAAPKNFHSSTKNLAHSSNEYVSVAEAVKKFQEKTPTRFHSKSKIGPDSQRDYIPIKLKATIPHSPMLLTKRRAKPTTNVISYEEREKLEFEEQQKFKIKAKPLNKKILQQPLKAIHIEKKLVTHPEPFNLTKVEPKKTAPSPKKDDYRFHANPVPKSVLQPPKLPERKPLKATEPITPTFVKTLPKASPIKKTVVNRISPLKKTKPEPFSFEKRDQRLLQKKEEFIKKTIEEEKRAREFHARPIPKPIASLINKQKQKQADEHITSTVKEDSKSSGCITEEHFKARPPVVLYQKPFEPKKVDHPLTEIQPFQLASEVRAKERENFEKKKKEMEEMCANLLRQEEQERLKEEQEEIKRIRKEIEFKAQPIKHFRGVQIKPSGKVTEPKSPVFRSGKANKENVV